MRVRHFLSVLGLVVAGTVGLASPAQAASGPWQTVSAGSGHTCAINSAKSLYCWGDNFQGEIGDGTIENDRILPKKIGASGVWASVSAGGNHTCAVTTGKSLYCWGDNGSGQIGDGTATERPSPTKVGTTGVWASVTTGFNHTCAITTGKSLYCWGDNGSGRIGDNTTTDRPSPTKIGTTGVWAQVAGGAFHTCAITTGKSLYCWGENNSGSLGDGTTIERHSPTKIGASGVWAQIAGGGSHTCAITTGKSLYCWGHNGSGQIGDGTSGIPNHRHSPKKIGASGAWADATGGDAHTCAISTGKSLYCWGSDTYGQIGDGLADDTLKVSPKKIGTSGVWASVTADGRHTCAITTGKSLYCWGENADGQVGDGTTTHRHSPANIP